MCTPFQMCPSIFTRARPSDWSASPAAGSPRSAAACSASSSRPRAASCSTAATSRRLTRAELRPLRRHLQIVFQDPYASLNPRMTRRRDHRRAAAAPRPDATPRRRERVAELLGSSELDPEHADRYPARVLRRPAAADRHRPCAGVRARAHRPRRAGLGARRLDPGRRSSICSRSCRRARPVLPVHRPRPLGGAPHLRPRGRDVSGQDRGDRRRAMPCSTAPQHPYTQALLSAVPIPDPRGSALAAASCSRATCRTRRRRPPAAASGPAASGPRRSAPQPNRSWCRAVTNRPWRVIFPVPSQLPIEEK